MRYSEINEAPSLVDVNSGWDNKKTSDDEMDDINSDSSKAAGRLRTGLTDIGNSFYYHARSKNLIHITADNTIDYKAEIGKEWVELPGLDRIDRAHDARYGIVQRMLQKKPGNTLGNDEILDALVRLAKQFKAGAIVSDDAQTLGGQKFWLKLLPMAVAKGYKVGFYDSSKATTNYLKRIETLDTWLTKHKVYSNYKRLLFIQI